MRGLTTIPPLVLALVLGGLSVRCEAQLRPPTDVQPAQRPARELQRELQKGSPSLQGPIGGKSPSQSGPGTSELPTNKGINMGKPFVPLDPGTKIPGAGGAATNQPSGQTTPALPTGTPLGGDRKNVGPQTILGDKGEKVSPGFFSREKQLKDLTDPKSGMKDLGSGMKDAGLGDPGKNPLGQKSGADLLGGIPTTVTPGQGKNASSPQDQKSDEPGSHIPGTATITRTSPDGTKTVEQRFRDGDKTTTTTYPDGTLVHVRVDRYGDTHTTYWVTDVNSGKPVMDRFVETKKDGSQMIQTRNASGGYDTKWTDKWGMPTKKRPDPETDTGDGHNPKGGILGAVGTAPKSPSEIEAERKRQVTLPGEGQAQPEHVYMSTEDALKGGIGQRTDGRIDPGDPTAATPTGSGSTTRRPGFGPERVDGRPGFATGSAPARPGNTPDNPTASQGPTTSQVPSTSTDKNTGGTTGDASNKP